MLQGGVLTPKANASEETRVESTSILTYLYRQGYLGDIAWLPADFVPYEDMEGTLGFGPDYALPIVPKPYFSLCCSPKSGSGLGLRYPCRDVFRPVRGQGKPASADVTVKGKETRFRSSGHRPRKRRFRSRIPRAPR